jgi:3-oxoacyl-[acyl-carrier protein] reductase
MIKIHALLQSCFTLLIMRNVLANSGCIAFCIGKRNETMKRLTGKTAIITGAGTGIGEGIAIAFAAEGAQVLLCGRRHDPLANCAAKIKQTGGDCFFLTADVSKAEDVEKVVEAALSHYGAIDILVNNAGVSGDGPIHQHSIAAWDRVMAINLRGPFLMSRAVLPAMRKQQEGHIINISSESALEHYPGNGAYGVSKHALNALSEYIQRENQELGIRVNVVCPGMVVTEMTETLSNLDHERSLFPEDIADLVLWLVTRRANIKIGRPVLIQTMENPWKT